MADHLQLRGAVTVDEGAVIKLRDEGKSLLPIGVTGVDGEYARGDVIAVRGPDGVEETTWCLARGCRSRGANIVTPVRSDAQAVAGSARAIW
jgi:glutamate 5-kinase